MRARWLLAAVVLVACERAGTDDAPVTGGIETPGSGDSIVAADTVAAELDSVRAPTTAEPAGDAAVEQALRAALDARVRGAAARVDSVEFSWFSEVTADAVRSVDVDAEGRAVIDLVDLRTLIPNASSSAGSEALLRELNATVFSVEGVRSVEYRMAGSCELLGEWLQYGRCLVFTREGARTP